MSLEALLRPMREGDYAWVLELNFENETETSRIDRAWLAKWTPQTFAALSGGQEEAFLIAFDQNAAYDSVNFLWFKQRFPKFVYVDRVVVAEASRGRGLAGAIYKALFTQARAAGAERIVCEVNAEPPNPASDAFHSGMGFTEIGRAKLANGKLVRYLARQL